MFRCRRPAAWLLVLALIASQWLLLVHDTGHWQPHDVKVHVCHLCSHHAAQDLIAGAIAAPRLDAPQFSAPLTARATAPRARTFRFYRSRAPPAVLA